MTPTYFNPPPSPFPENQDHHQFPSPKLQASSSSSSHSYPIFCNPIQDHEGSYDNELQPLRLPYEAEKLVLGSKSTFDHPIMEVEIENSYKVGVWKKEDEHENQCENNNSVQWMSSKMRMMRKMMSSDKIMGGEKQTPSPLETDNSSNTSYNNSNTIRVCTDCNTTKTPLWRSGPRGPKSLCNACGIRQRKARRAAAAAANGTVVAADTQSMKKKVQHKDKKTINSQLPFKKRCKLITTAPSCSQKKLCFEDFTLNFSKNSACQRAFPQELKEAAILLMALSSGLVHG